MKCFSDGTSGKEGKFRIFLQGEAFKEVLDYIGQKRALIITGREEQAKQLMKY
ncbi:MAG: hypothetical protein J7L34_06510 [Thermotogaceae bacterium]|nr:hypothetical protein [Thermotogaceae bacterium]